MSSSLHQTKEMHPNVPLSVHRTSQVADYGTELTVPTHVPVCGRSVLASVSRFWAETGQQAHKHGTGRCYALDPALSPDAARSRWSRFIFTHVLILFLRIAMFPVSAFPRTCTPHETDCVAGPVSPSQPVGIVLFV